MNNLRIAQELSFMAAMAMVCLALGVKWDLADNLKKEKENLAVVIMLGEAVAADYPATSPIGLWSEDARRALQKAGFSQYAPAETRWKVKLFDGVKP